ncbi:MAG: chemotaxis protein CheX [Planctomycetaceae bacterium]|jgi:chemotaxis protein CheX|nr:chemotaxis protein CheX [Planctomycetaceae bacterium]
MSTDIASEIKGLVVNTLIVNSTITSVEKCLEMCNLKMRVVGVTQVPIQFPNTHITGLIGLNGKCTGFISIAMPERVAIAAVSGLSMESYKSINTQIIDGVGEITNIIAGGIKTKLYNTQWTINNITIPSVILGSNYQISYSKGIDYCSISFEIDDPDSLTIQDRVFTVTSSLIQTTGN